MCLNDYYTSSLNDDCNLFLANVRFQKKVVTKEKIHILMGFKIRILYNYLKRLIILIKNQNN